MPIDTLPAEAEPMLASQSYSLGYRFGFVAGEYEVGVTAARSASVERLISARHASSARLSDLQRSCDQAVRRSDERKETVETFARRSLVLEQSRFNLPSEYSWSKGLFYMFLCFGLIGADISLLGEVFAKLLARPWVATDNLTTFPLLLLKNPWLAWVEFADLFLLCLTMLLIGMVFKVLHDILIFRTTHPRNAKLDRWEWWAAIVACVFACVCLGLLSWVRLEIPFEEGVPKVANYFSAAVGFALPIISVVFFIRGYDILTNLTHQRWVARNLRRARNGLGETERQVESLFSERNRARHEHARITLTESETHARHLASAEYANGYRRGIADLLNRVGSGGLSARLRPAAVRILLSNK